MDKRGIQGGDQWRTQHSDEVISSRALDVTDVDLGAGAVTVPTMFWKSAAGAGGVLTAAQRTALYNGGAGLTYAAFTV